VLRHLAGRLGQAAVSIWGVLTIVFFVLHLSGDPTLLLVPPDASAAEIALLRHALGFDRPLLVQYLAYLGHLLRLDLGQSLVQRLPVATILASRVPYTLELTAGALVVATGIGLPAGAAMALWRGQWPERALAPLVLAGQSLPTFWSGILMILLFGVVLGWLPTSGAQGFAALVMPSVALGALTMATFARMMRVALLDELSRDYVTAARARGLSLGAVVLRHALRNAAIPLVTIAALEIGNLMAGAVIVETVFAWPGIGQLAIQSIAARDFLVVQAVVLFVSIVYVLSSLLADIAYAVIDPRIRLAA
jgi:peptide/nickel transport system permease protein